MNLDGIECLYGGVVVIGLPDQVEKQIGIRITLLHIPQPASKVRINPIRSYDGADVQFLVSPSPV